MQIAFYSLKLLRQYEKLTNFCKIREIKKEIYNLWKRDLNFIFLSRQINFIQKYYQYLITLRELHCKVCVSSYRYLLAVIYNHFAFIKKLLAPRSSRVRARIRPWARNVRSSHIYDWKYSKGGHWSVEIRKFWSNLCTSPRFEGSTDRSGRTITGANARNRKL